MEKHCNDINKTIAVQCILHTSCNLRCKFCFETKEKGIREHNHINIDYIRNLPDEIVQITTPIIKQNNVRVFKAEIMGGELFHDGIPDSLFDEYEKFLYNLERKVKEQIPDIKFAYFFTTNGIFTKRDRVEKFLSKFNSKISLSYDPCDRFTTDEQKKIWYDTFLSFNKLGFHISVDTLLTKRNINAYIAGDEIFEKLGPGVCVDNLEYAPRLDYQEYLPSDNDMFNFYKWALDNNKFNMYHVNDLLNHKSSCNPGSSYIFGESFGGHKKYIHECIEDTPLSKEYYFGKFADKISRDNKYSTIACIGIEKRGCLLCEYYNQCPKVCWKNILFDKYEISECPIKRIYQYLEENPTIIDRYNDWREKYESEWRKFIYF